MNGERTEVALLICDPELAKWLSTSETWRGDRDVFIRVIPSDQFQRMGDVMAVFGRSYEWGLLPGLLT